MTQQEGERLARFLAHAGVASRRHAEGLIAAGRVRVNGATITTQGTRIDPQRDTVTVDGKAVQAATRHVYIMLHKPVGYVTTASDPQGRPTVLDLLPGELRRLRVYPVGRLDIDTSGLLLLTNDGDFAQRMTHPRYSTEKHYEALVRGCPTGEALAALREGVTVVVDDERSYRTSPARVHIVQRIGGNCRLAVTIREGRKRQVRRMISTVGYRVLELKRVAVGKLTLGNLAVGEWRYLVEEEVKGLM
ncbi:MAG TPA: pseudouridine synthase [Ktedonobacteraceae bacterium]|jgi:23S rRNA pseudouridine2605 synthase|nr:pseudouridine synthase [Ktedonobacteraceae bacterium]